MDGTNKHLDLNLLDYDGCQILHFCSILFFLEVN